MKYEPKSKLQNSQIPPTEITLADLYLAVLNLPGARQERHRDLLSAIVRIGSIAGRGTQPDPRSILRRLTRLLEEGAPGHRVALPQEPPKPPLLILRRPLLCRA